MTPQVQIISMWDSLGTFTNSPDCPQTWETSWPALPMPSSIPEKYLEMWQNWLPKGSSEPEARTAPDFGCSRDKHRAESQGTWNKIDLWAQSWTKLGQEWHFCHEKLHTAGFPNALFVAFPCFLLFSNSIWIAFLFLGSWGRKGIISHSSLGLPREIFPPVIQHSKILNKEIIFITYLS